MKRRFYQILKSVSFVACVALLGSCKDTNEDLFFSLKLESVAADAKLQEALDTQAKNMGALQQQIDALQAALAGINSCDCDKDALNATIAGINAVIDGLNLRITGLTDQIADLQNNKADAADVAALQEELRTLTQLVNDYGTIIVTLQENYTTLNNFMVNTAATKAELEAAKAELEAKIAELKTCDCPVEEMLARLAEVETTLTSALSKAQEAATNAQAALVAAQQAQTAADNAATAAANAATVAANAATVAANAATAAADAAAKADNALGNAAAAQQAADVAKQTADAAQGVADAAKALSESVKTMAETNAQNIQNNAQSIQDIKLDLVTINNTLSETYNLAVTANTLAQSNVVAIEDLSTRVERAETNINNLNTSVNTLTNNVTTLTSTVTSLESTVGEHTTLITNLQSSVSTLQSNVTTLETNLSALTSTVEEVKTDVDKLKTDVQTLFTDVDDLNNQLGDLNNKVDSLDNALNRALETKITEDKAKELIDAAVKIVNDKVDANSARISDLEVAYKEADQLLQNQINDLKSDVQGLATRVAKNEQDINDILKVVSVIQDVLAKQVTSITIQGTCNPAFGSLTLPTGLQSNVLVAYYGEAVNDVYFPTNRTGNYINAYEALTTKDMEMIGASDEPLFDAGSMLLANGENNAGTVYLTVNPNTVDYTGLKLNIENSQAQASAIKLGALKESDKVLSFGYSRAAGNAFYEAPARLEAKDIDKVQKVNFNVGKIAETVKEIYKNRRNARLSVIANDIHDVITGLNLDRNAVKCEWQDAQQKHAVYSEYNLAATAVEPFGFGFAKDLNVQTIPGYERANALLERLVGTLKNKISFYYDRINASATVKDIQSLTISDIVVEDLTEDLIANFVVTMNRTFYVDGIKFNIDVDANTEVAVKYDINFSDVTEPAIVINTKKSTAMLVVPVRDMENRLVGSGHLAINDVVLTNETVTINGKTIAIDKSGNSTIVLDEVMEVSPESFRINYTVDLSESAEEIWGVAQDAAGDLNAMLADLRKIVKHLNQELDIFNNYEARIDATIDNYVDKVCDYIDRANDKLAGFINSINDRLQPVMLVSTLQGAKRMSRSKNYPTVLEDVNPVFIPSTWTVELAVPVCRKHVAVTNVFNGEASAQDGDADCLKALQNANRAAEMNTVFDGNQRRVFAKNFTKGYVYEVAYSAMDFQGKLATRKYYILISK